VIRINLLPHREAARRRRLESFYATVGGFAVIGVVVSGLLYVLLDMQLTAQNQTNQLLQNEIKRIEGQIKDVATVQAELATLRARQQAVESLQTQRNQPVRLLNELVRQLPDGVYLTSMRQAGAAITLTGQADSNERVSELLRNLGNNSDWLGSPELVEIVAGSVTLGNRGATRVSNFSVRVQIKAPKDKAEPAAGEPAKKA
jgi:type IV pilus assembly protein PilN